MSLNSPITVIAGNLTSDPELVFLDSGAPVANFTVAHNVRTYDRARGEWADGPPVFMRAKAWRHLAEHIAESLTRGDRVVVVGTLSSRSFLTREGENRTVTELNVDEIGASLQTATVTIAKAARPGNDQPTAAHAGEPGAAGDVEPPV